MEYVKRLPESQSSASQPHIVGGQMSSTPMNNGTSSVVTADPFHFEPYSSSTDDIINTGGPIYGGRHVHGPSNNR